MNKPVSEIFLVMADTMYEGGTPVCAFERKEDAEAFAQACRDYDATYPVEVMGKLLEDDFDEWHAAEKKWVSGHPGEQTSTQFGYSVHPLPFGPATKS